jgi:hypothetical protein
VDFGRQVKRVVKKIWKRRKLLLSVIHWNTNMPVLVVTIWSPRINTRTIQNLIYYLERKYFIFLILPNPFTWISFFMYLYPYRHVSIVPGWFLVKKKYFLTDKSWGLGATRLYFSSIFPRNKSTLPYFKHPSLCWPQDEIHFDEKETRKGFIFFAGNINPDLYNKDNFSLIYGIPNRYQVYTLLRAQTFALEDTFFQEDNPDHHRKLLIHTLQRNSLDEVNYNRYLRSFSFMVCAPGVSMPLCHNLVEAFAFGCIPIFSYPEWMPLGLENGHNCFIYKNLQELSDILVQCIKLTDRDIRLMREHAHAYYQINFLNLIPDIKSYSSLTLLNEEKNMIQ